MIHGYGKFYYKDGSFYEGDFKLDKKDGPGVLTMENGQAIKGIWNLDELQETFRTTRELRQTIVGRQSDDESYPK